MYTFPSALALVGVLVPVAFALAAANSLLAADEGVAAREGTAPEFEACDVSKFAEEPGV